MNIVKPSGANELESSVIKSTDSKETPPKRKHVRKLIVNSGRTNGAIPFYRALVKRPIDKDEVVCFKAVLVTHHLLQEGHPRCLSDSHYQSSLFQTLATTMKAFVTPRGYGPIAGAYASFILQKIGFHNKHPDVEGDLSLDKYQKAVQGKQFDHNYTLQLTTHLLDLQDEILKLQALVFSTKEKTELKYSCLIPLVLESFAAYRLSSWLLKKVVDGLESVDVFSFITEKFNTQFMGLRSFYFEASNVRSVSTVVAVPTLPQEPPKFVYTPRSKQTNQSQGAGFEVSSDMGQGFGWGQGQGFDPFGSNPNDPFNSTFQQRPMFDQYGNPIEYDQFGNPIQKDQWGNPIEYDQFGNPIQKDRYGNRIEYDQYGNPIEKDQFGNPIMKDRYGNPIEYDQFGNPIEKDQFGNPIKKDRYGNPIEYDQFGNPIEKDQYGNPVNKRPQYDAFGNPIQYDQFGNPINDPFSSAGQGQGKPQFDAFGNPIQYDQFGNPITGNNNGQQGSQYGDQYIDPNKRAHGAGGQDGFDPYGMGGQGGQGGQAGQGGQGAQGQQGQGQGGQTPTQAQTTQMQQVQPQTAPQKIQIAKVSGDSKDTSLLEKRIKELEEKLLKEGQEKLVLQKEVAQQKHENASLKFKMQDMARQRENDLRTARVRTLNEQLDHLEKIAGHLDDPSNLGNEYATPDDLSQAAQTVLELIEKLHASTEKNQEDMLTSAAVIVPALETLMGNAKGASRNSNSVATKQELFDALRNTNSATESLFQILKTAPQNQAMVGNAVTIAKTQLPNIQKIAIKLKEEEGKKVEDVEQEDSLHLEELAHQELLAAARIIEEAAASLLKAKAAPKPAKVVLTETQMKVADSIVDAAMAIAKATANLVTFAGSAQKERVERGLQGDQNKAYRPDRTWSEGLISAAKLVASATSQLVEVAHKAVLGELDEATLIAASKQVTAATSQLVAACRSKSEPGSKSLQNLETASKAVTSATNHLVEAAKAAGASSESEEIVIKSTTNAALAKAQEMEQQAVIYRLEQALEQARKKLFKIRQAAYAGSSTPTPSSSIGQSSTPESATQAQ